MTTRTLLERLVPMWLVVPVIVMVADIFTAEGTYDFYFGMLVWPLLSLVWIGMAVVSFVWFLRFTRARDLRKSLLSLLLPAAMLLDRNWLIYEPVYAGDVIHFATVKSSYDRQVAAIDPADKRVVQFNWGGMLFASKGVVYDVTDELALPTAKRSAAWIAREKDTDLMCGDRTLRAGVRPLWDHYYLTGFGC